LVKVFVVYDSKYGNTKLVAEKIVEGIKEVDGIETAISIGYAKEVNPEEVAVSDVVIIGAPNHMGKPSRMIRKFVDKLAKAEVKANWTAVFDTYMGRMRENDRAMKKLEKTVTEKIPSLKVITPGLSVRVEHMSGPITDGEFPKIRDFANRIAQQMNLKR